MSLKDFALLAKLEELDLESHKIVKLFEKSERHVFSADIRHLNGDLLQLVIEAVKMQQEERKARRPLLETKKLLRRIDVKIEFYKVQVRKLADAVLTGWSACDEGKQVSAWNASGGGSLDAALYARNEPGAGLFPPDAADFDAWERRLAVWPQLQPALPGDFAGMAYKLDRYRLTGNGVCPLAAGYAARNSARCCTRTPESGVISCKNQHTGEKENRAFPMRLDGSIFFEIFVIIFSFHVTDVLKIRDRSHAYWGMIFLPRW